MILLAALAAAAAMTGLVLFVAELTRRPSPAGTPARAGGVPFAGAWRRIAIGVIAGLVVLLLTRWPVGGLAAVAAVIFLPTLSFFGGGPRHRTAMLEGLEQWIRRLADMLTASRGLEDALQASVRTAPAAIAGPVGLLGARLAARTGAETALREFAAEINDPAGDRIAAALIIATGRRGGASRDVLSALAEMLARDVASRREIDAERAQHRTTIKWICVFMIGFTAFAVLNRSYSAPFGTVLGQVVLAFVALLYAGGFAWLHRLGSIPAPGRFLDDPQSAPSPGQADASLQRRAGPSRAAVMAGQHDDRSPAPGAAGRPDRGWRPGRRR